jgi:hypothetical protein
MQALYGILSAFGLVDKVPGADHVNDVVQTFLRPAAGAILFGASTGVIGSMHPAIALVLGLLMALGVHGTKVAARATANASTAGLAAPVISTIENVVSVVATALAILVPVVLVALFIVGAVVAWQVLKRRADLRRRQRAST